MSPEDEFQTNGSHKASLFKGGKVSFVHQTDVKELKLSPVILALSH